MLEQLPPSSATSLAVDLLSGTVAEDRGDHLIVRTPANPTYHWGNFVQVTTGDVDDAARWIEVFEAEFPAASHCAIGLPARPDRGAWAGRGLRIEADESLTAGVVPDVTPVPEGYRVRPLEDDADWALRLDAELDENDRAGEYPRAEHRLFLESQIRARRELVDRGDAAWFGAFTGGGELAASLGIVNLGERARYQYVLTSHGHRRHGLARHLLTVAGRWAADREARELVIVAESGSDAGRLYARAGFTPGRLGYGAYSATWPSGARTSG